MLKQNKVRSLQALRTAEQYAPGRYGYELLTYKDLMSIMHISKTRAYELMKSECFPTIVINHRMYVTRRKLEQWIDTYTNRSYIL